MNPGRFRTDETRIRVLGGTAGMLGEVEAVRRELGTDQIQLKPGSLR